MQTTKLQPRLIGLIDNWRIRNNIKFRDLDASVSVATVRKYLRGHSVRTSTASIVLAGIRRIGNEDDPAFQIVIKEIDSLPNNDDLFSSLSASTTTSFSSKANLTGVGALASHKKPHSDSRPSLSSTGIYVTKSSSSKMVEAFEAAQTTVSRFTTYVVHVNDPEERDLIQRDLQAVCIHIEACLVMLQRGLLHLGLAKDTQTMSAAVLERLRDPAAGPVLAILKDVALAIAVILAL